MDNEDEAIVAERLAVATMVSRLTIQIAAGAASSAELSGGLSNPILALSMGLTVGLALASVDPELGHALIEVAPGGRAGATKMAEQAQKYLAEAREEEGERLPTHEEDTDVGWS